MASPSSLERLEMAQKAYARQGLQRSGRDFYDDYDEDSRFAEHQLTSAAEPCIQTLLSAPGVFAVIVVDVATGSVLASSDPSSSTAVKYASHVPALVHRAQLLLSDDGGDAFDNGSSMLLISTRKMEMLLMANRDAQAAVLVLQDRGSSRSPLVDDLMFAWPDSSLARPGRSGPL